MLDFLGKYKNPAVLGFVLLAQIIGLATQVKRPADPANPDAGSVRLIRVWVATAVTPFEKMMIGTGRGLRSFWSNYVDLRGVRQQNRELQARIEELQQERTRLSEAAMQGRRLQALLEFKEQLPSQTVAAQVIGTSGSEHSRTLYIDKGSRDGLAVDMPVMTQHGIIGKVMRVFPTSAQVLQINDLSAGAGVILEQSRLRGILKGNAAGELVVRNIMGDETVQVGERVLTTGGDRVFPRGVAIGNVASVAPDPENDPFLLVKVKPTANLNRIEEVLVVTKVVEQPVVADIEAPKRAADVLAERLPTVKPKPPAPATGAAPAPSGAPAGAGASGAAQPGAARSQGTAVPQPATTNRPASSSAQPAAGATQNRPTGTATRPPAQNQTQPAQRPATPPPAEPPASEPPR